MKKDTTFTNKDGYAKSVDISIPSQNLEIDPRSKSTTPLTKTSVVVFVNTLEILNDNF